MEQNLMPNCKHPDRDAPKLVCGYPLPCPHHTATIDAEKGELRIPLTAASALRARRKLTEMGHAIVDELGKESTDA